MAAHRYWRIQIRATGGGGNGGIGELELRESLGGANVAKGGTASASSVFGTTTYPAAKAFDGLTTDTGSGNGWASAAFAGSNGLGSRPWLQYDFGAGNYKDIAEIVIYAPGASGIAVSELPTAWSFQYSDDGVKWVEQRAYQATAEVAAWALGTSRIYDVRPLGAINIHNQVQMQIHCRNISPPPGQPTAPVYDPDSPSGQIRPCVRDRYAYDPTHGGMYKLAGSTTSLGSPVARRVRLYYQADGRIYAEQYTREDGLFEFKNLDVGPWTVVGIDDTGTQNGVIFSHVNAVPM